MCRLFSKIYKRNFYRARRVALYKYDTSMVIDQAFRIITWYPPAGRNPLCVVYGSAEQIFIAHPSEPLSEPTLIKISNMGSFSKMFIGGGNCNTRRIQDIFYKSITNCLLMFTSEMYNILVYLKHILLSHIYNRIKHKFYNLYDILFSIMQTQFWQRVWRIISI
jgi:hypothetical protein